MNEPFNLYINWASYDELSDAVPLTEAVAMRQLDALLSLRQSGVRFDGYLMDCFWYARDGGYRSWRKPHWPDGPDRWLDRCLEAGLTPGLWFACNNFARHCQLDPHPAWKDSVSESGHACAFFTGGFLAHWLESLHIWYECGFRVFKLDFANLNAAPSRFHEKMLPSEVRAANIAAFQAGLRAFRNAHPDVLFLAYNGFEENELDTPNFSPRKTMCATGKGFPKIIDEGWLEVVDSIYSGDPRLSDIPCWNFWRSKDLYSNHMVRLYEANGLPLKRIDSSGFMIGDTGTCYFRKKAAWKAMLILTYARGGWMNTLYGDLSLLTPEDAEWIKRVQDFFLPLQARAQWSTFGGVPGAGEPHGFSACLENARVYTVVNPAPEWRTLALPDFDRSADADVIFADSGAAPEIMESGIRLGPEALAVVATGSLAGPTFGREHDVSIAREQTELPVENILTEKGRIRAQVRPGQAQADLLITFQQSREWGDPVRTTGGWPPDGRPMDAVIRVRLKAGDSSLPFDQKYGKQIWSGISWAAVLVDKKDLPRDTPVDIEVSTEEPEADALRLRAFSRFAD
jgi:hypothetical protein